MSLKSIIWNYTDKKTRNKAERSKLTARIEQREKQIERLKARLDKTGYVSWVDELLESIAKAMVAKMPDRHYEIFGPFGMTSETSIRFYKNGVEQAQQFDGDNCRSITFRPRNLDKGKIVLVDHTQNTGRYVEGTMGEVNGMNYPTIPMKNTIDKLLDFMTEQETKTKVVA